jgi:hypothetical protein
MKKKYPSICNGLPECILQKLNRYSKGPKDPVEQCRVEIYDKDYDALSPEDRMIISLKGIKINRKKIHFGIECYTSSDYAR